MHGINNKKEKRKFLIASILFQQFNIYSISNTIAPKLVIFSITMHSTYSSLPLLTIFLFLLPSPIQSQMCQRNCGKQPLRYPFGGGPGCGDPRFQPHITCNQQKLTFTTHTGSYPINSIDYTNQIIHISDPTMSTCSCTLPSKGFGLDWNAPFTFDDSTVFALVDCSMNSSSICKSRSYDDGNNAKLQCDQNTQICDVMYSCRPISTNINLPISTCCVYTPVNLGPSFQMDLEKLQCSSYTGFYNYNDQQVDPEKWNYGIALKYKFSVTNDYPSSCEACERSYGFCGYSEAYNSFLCNCPNGINTTTDCFFISYNHGFRNGFAWLIYVVAWCLVGLIL